MPVLLAVFTAISACDCDDVGGLVVDVLDADTLEPVSGAEVVVASTIYGPRRSVDRVLDPGEYWLWARAPGYRRERRKVIVELQCYYDEEARDRLVIELEPR